MIIRDATKNDLDAVFAINQANVPHVGSVDINWFQTYLPLAQYFRVIEVDNEVVGFMVAMLPSTDYKSENFLWFKKQYGSFIYVDRIAIQSTHIGKGYGKSLYEDLALQYKDKVDMITCEVNTRPANPDSLAFHKRLGFDAVGTLITKGGTIEVSLLRKSIV